jgi:hypothetical protein
MRIRTFAFCAALLLAPRVIHAQPPWLSTGQTPAPPASQPSVPETTAPERGLFDFGYRGTDTDDDEARYERYRDLRNGAASRFTFAQETTSYAASANAFNIGYRDQRYGLDYARSKTRFAFQYDSIPINYGYLTYSPWTVNDSGVLTLDLAARQQVQNRLAVGVPCAPGGPPAACSNPTQAAAALANRSIFAVNQPTFAIQSKRDITSFALAFDPTQALGVDVSFASTGKTGLQPWGASFAFNVANEVPVPLDNRTNDIGAGIEWKNPKGMVRFAWNGSYFTNDVQTLVWDNPVRATDFNNGLLPPNGPYDPNGYSNGNGPAQGRMSLWPSNTQNVVSGTALYKMPNRTSLNGTLVFTRQTQNEELIPWTINPVIANTPAVLAAFPNLRALPRPTAEAEVQGVNALINLNSRPASNVNFTVRYRYNRRDNQSTPFDATEWVRFDAVPEETDESISHQFDVSRRNFDANVSYTFTGWGALRGGYGREEYARTGRGFSSVGEDVFRVTFDTVSTRWLSLRAAYEHGIRRGQGFIESDTDDEGPGGTQPGLRYYDEADRNRNRGSVTLSFTPTDTAAISFTYAGGHDDFDLPDEACAIVDRCERFGLLRQGSNAFTAGVDYTPRDTIGVGVNYGYEKFSALQNSRNANPAPDPSWFDPTRNWELDNDEQVNTLTFYADLLHTFRNTDLRFSLDFMDSSNAFVFGGPRIMQLNTNTTVTGNPPCPAGVSDCFIEYPDVESRWTRFTADLRYFFATNVGAGFTFWYEDQNLRDFATIDSNGSVPFTGDTGAARADYLGELFTGYGARPYRGITSFVRLLYRF